MICFIAFSAWGDELLPLEFERTFLYNKEKIRVKSEKKGLSTISLKVYRGDDNILTYEGAALDKRLRRINFISKILLLFWKSGNHCEMLMALDVEKKRIVWEKFSTWPMEVNVDKGKIYIHYTGEQINADKYEEFTKIINIGR